MNPAVLGGLIGAAGGPLLVSAAAYLWHAIRSPFRLLGEYQATLETFKEAELQRQALSEDACALLLFVVECPRGIWCSDDSVDNDAGLSISSDERREYARWKAAFQELFAKTLIEPTGNNGRFDATNKGILKADELKQGHKNRVL